MQQYQIEEEEAKDSHEYGSNPGQDDFSKLISITKIDLSTTDSHMHNDDNSKSEGGDNTDHKGDIISLANTIIEPHTVMIELIHTAVASTTMFAIRHTITVAELAVENFIVLWCEGDFFVMS